MIDLKDLTTAQREQVCREVLETSVKHAMGPIYLGQVLRGDEPQYITKEQREVIDAAVTFVQRWANHEKRTMELRPHSEFGMMVASIRELTMAVKKLEGE